MTGRWTVVVPVKRFELAKTRLNVDIARADLAAAFFRDTLETVRATIGVAQVLVVTSDPQAGRFALGSGAWLVSDHPSEGLNAAITRAARQARASSPLRPLAVVPADLPSLRADQLQRVLDNAADHPLAFLADHTRRGTTVLAAARPELLAPAFEGHSSRSHRLGGAHEITGVAAPTVRLDVDTAQDLELARLLGVGRHTRRALGQVPLVQSVAPGHRPQSL